MFDIGLDKSILSVTALSHVLSKDDFARRTASNAINPAPPIAPAIIQFFVKAYIIRNTSTSRTIRPMCAAITVFGMYPVSPLQNTSRNTAANEPTAAMIWLSVSDDMNTPILMYTSPKKNAVNIVR